MFVVEGRAKSWGKFCCPLPYIRSNYFIGGHAPHALYALNLPIQYLNPRSSLDL